MPVGEVIVIAQIQVHARHERMREERHCDAACQLHRQDNGAEDMPWSR